ncbi:MAG TPA: TolC family protein [Cyclobacteriaceae bacterium]|jgi:NodT family efflux transporter outer membrane factor (OMF) lipoprotein|nr:TolC family protein [Cyclobacteriaceae bacterium]
MSINKKGKYIPIFCLSILYTACTVPSVVLKNENKNVPENYKTNSDTFNTAKIKWKDFYSDTFLNALIDTALRNNQELNIILQDINIAKNEVKARKGAYLPFADIGGGVGIDKSARYTRQGAVDATTDIEPGKPIPDVLPDYLIAANISWEVDIWKKLRNARKSSIYSFLSTTSGKNFMVTHLIAEIANAYYELMALDNQLFILKQNIQIQKNALEIVKLEKTAAKVTELAVRRFEAEVLKNQSRIFFIQQSIIETENRINFLVGRFPRPIMRDSWSFIDLNTDSIQNGIPAQLLLNRPDIKQAELDLATARLDVKVAKANFYPTLNITGAIGFESFNPTYLVSKPESMFYNLGAGLFGPLINRNAIKAAYYNASARQIQAAFNYERTILTAYIEVANQLSNINNLQKSYELRSKQVQTLTLSIDISTRLFRSARADYMEVLLTQRDALESKFELIETKKRQMNAKVNIYKALGGGWN